MALSISSRRSLCILIGSLLIGYGSSSTSNNGVQQQQVISIPDFTFAMMVNETALQEHNTNNNNIDTTMSLFKMHLVNVTKIHLLSYLRRTGFVQELELKALVHSKQHNNNQFILIEASFTDGDVEIERSSFSSEIRTMTYDAFTSEQYWELLHEFVRNDVLSSIQSLDVSFFVPNTNRPRSTIIRSPAGIVKKNTSSSMVAVLVVCVTILCITMVALLFFIGYKQYYEKNESSSPCCGNSTKSDETFEDEDDDDDFIPYVLSSSPPRRSKHRQRRGQQRCINSTIHSNNNNNLDVITEEDNETAASGREDDNSIAWRSSYDGMTTISLGMQREDDDDDTILS